MPAALPRAVALVALFTAAAVIVTWPLATQMTTHLGALAGPGDPYLNLWILGWGLEQWTTDPLGVLSGRAFDANIFHPATGTLTYSDHLLLPALVLAPLYAATGDVVLCYNVLLLISMAASGLAMYALARGVTGSTAGAIVAGLAWAVWPYRTAHLLHLQLQALYFLPLALLCLHRLVARPGAGRAAALGVVAGLQAIASVYYGVMTAVVLAVATPVLAWTTGQARARRLWAQVALAAAVGSLLVAPVLWPYLQSAREGGFGRSLYEAANHAAGPVSYIQVPPDNLLYGRTGLLAPRPPAAGARDRSGVEHQLFPGIVLLVLGLAGVAGAWRREGHPAVVSALALVVTGGVLSLGPEGARTLYAALHDHVFGFQAVRAPARFAVIATAGLALLAAFGTRTVLARAGRARQVAAVALAVLVLAEYANGGLSFAVAPPRETPVGQWLKSAPEPGAVLHLPLDDDAGNTPAMVQSLEHGRALVNGYSGQRPPFYSALVESMAAFPAPVALAALREIGVTFVVAPAPVGGAGTLHSPLVERARFDEAVVYELRWTPDAEAALAAAAEVLAPPPGPRPFSPGEMVTFEVTWESGPMDVPAGTVVVEVEDAPYRFTAAVETAEWLAPFFEAEDRFTTEADEALLPTVHAREIREGRRAFDRAYVYDHAARRVTVGETEAAARLDGAVSLPLAAGARDALTAFFYVRTLTFTPGVEVRVPINEAGRGQTLVLAVEGRETIAHEGGQIDTWRLRPRLERLVERRTPLDVTLWMSADDRRVPVRIEVNAGFGRMLVLLTGYAPGR
ncbi:MAG: DUF3108 domain-containing protein [Vicinamibacterales bacterium]|nr:DUF3108 domain-containing protein [Vicinamibacterales bacterium]